jgi:hypothetical protein
MTEPVGRITQSSDPELWQSLYKQWLEERKPGWIARHAGGESWQVVQLVNQEVAFDPQSQKSLYETTSF